MKRLVAVFAAVLSISLAGSLTAMTLEPSPAIPQTQPVILGEVSEVGNHTVTVTAPGEEQMTFEFDSRTMMPANLDNGQRVKVEYRILDSGLHLAQRVTPLTVGSRDWAELDHEMSLVPAPEENRDNERAEAEGRSGMLVASTAPSNGENAADQEQVSQNQQPQSGSSMDQRNVNGETPAQEQREESQEHQMPRTASGLPWLLVGSGLTMLLAGGLWLLRRIGRTA